jgi:hypothetical protein
VTECRLDITTTVEGKCGRLNGNEERGRAFFCNRAILVHFFSNNVSYFFAVASSKTFSPRPNSARREAAAFGKLFADRYAMIDLCLGKQRQLRQGALGVVPHLGDATYSSSACRLVNIEVMVGMSLMRA